MVEGQPETEADFKARIALAHQEHDRADKGLLGLFPATSTFAVEALKAPALVNGGSAAAMLAFVGTGRQPVTTDTILGLKLFAAGLLTASLAPAVSWLAQFFYLAAADKAERKFTHPFVEFHPIYQRSGNIARLAVIGLVLGAYVLAGLGMWSVSCSLVPLPATSTATPTK